MRRSLTSLLAALFRAEPARRAGGCADWTVPSAGPGRRWAAACILATLLLAGCGWFSKSTAPDLPAGQDPFAEGVLRVISARAPPGSVSQYLAGIADQLGWESQLTQNTLLRQAIVAGQFEQRVQPFLLSLFFRNGYTVLPSVGDGHQINRDTIIRGVAGVGRLLVGTRDAVHIIFLGPVQNVQVVYPQDGKEPQVFTIDGGVVAVRPSLSESFLR
jgi:hypothetical protein